MNQLNRRAAALLAACAIFFSTPSTPRAAAVPAIDKRITYILPHWAGLITADAGQVATQVQALRDRIGPEGQRVRLGFTTYINVSMADVNPDDLDAVRAQLAGTFAQIRTAIARGVENHIPICLSFLTAIRGSADALQIAAESQDRRNMQWYSDGSLASGWTTYSRYARKQERIQEAYVRELGRFVANRMAQYPDILVAASGDGEIELSPEGSDEASPSTARLADYSPFAIAEFRDWLRGTGWYAAGQRFAGEAYANSASYNADASLGTLNADFGTHFTTWQLRNFEWSLADSETADPNAIPSSAHGPGPLDPNTIANGFDAPRTHQRGNPWSDLWDQFRQTMVWRHNLEFAKWMTTSVDGSSGATVPADRWFTDQIPADFLFTNVGILPSNPAGFSQPATFRLDTSASPHWTADVTPYGSMGVTSFNLHVGQTPSGDVYYRTLAAVAPVVAARGVRWGIFEWNPSTPPTSDPTMYDQELALVEKYRPSVIAPFTWEGAPDLRILDTPFETALRNFVVRRNNPPLTLSRSTLYAKTVTDGSSRTPPQVVRVFGEPGETPSWTVSSTSAFLDLVMAPDGRSFSVQLKPQAYAAGAQSATIVVTPTTPGYTETAVTFNFTASLPGTSGSPVGSFDTPADNSVVSGEVGVTGWAVDDIGIVAVDVFRAPLAGEPTAANGLVPLGSATLVPGARGDVLTAYPTTPLAEQAGWGYMLLTNMLPAQGNGIFTLYAVARDVEGHVVVLGSRRINCQNSATDRPPFGTIDTPGQGATVSGTIVNFGWALSVNAIPLDGSTIGVYIDNVLVGHPVYNQVRSDIAQLFPGYPNTSGSNGAVGYYVVDTTAYTNGVHTIAWVVTDSAGRSSGMGSRYFTIANP